jgi:hypothetical protein
LRLSDGVTEEVLPSPPTAAYRTERYSPTGCAVDGDHVWVADGYGAGLVHRFSTDGTLELTLDGAAQGVGRFACPHACLVDRRRSPVDIYVADRANHRLVVFDQGGRCRRVVGDGFLIKPSAMTTWEDLLIVADVAGRLTVLDIHDRLVGHIGERPAISEQPAGFPNILDDSGKPMRPDTLTPGRFNSPHDVTSDPSGNLYVTEYVIGGRLTKLARVRP